MNVFEVAQEVNDRVNDGDESKFPITLLLVAEVLYAFKPIDYFEFFTRQIAYSGAIDEFVMERIGGYNENDSLEPMVELQDFFNTINQGLVEVKSKVVRLLCVPTLLSGVAVAVGCYMVFR